MKQQRAEIAIQSTSLAAQGSTIQQQQVWLLSIVLGLLVISGLLVRMLALAKSRQTMNVDLAQARDELETRV